MDHQDEQDMELLHHEPASSDASDSDEGGHELSSADDWATGRPSFHTSLPTMWLDSRKMSSATWYCSSVVRTSPDKGTLPSMPSQTRWKSDCQTWRKDDSGSCNKVLT